MNDAPRLAGVELGGTKAIAVLGYGTEIVERARFPVADAAETLAAVADQLRHWHEVEPIAALGVASFGPVDIRPGSATYGQMHATPKPGWRGADVLGELQRAAGCPAIIHTDVTAAALAEAKFGAARGCQDHVYMTIGTGVGIGIVTGGYPLTGQLHPEGGHASVRRMPGDSFAGNCPFHGDCLEGLVSGPAIAARAGRPGSELGDDDPAWDPVVDAIAEACANLFMVLASERIVLGGGVINDRLWLVDAVGRSTAEKLGDYLPYIRGQAPIAAAELGADAGPRGSLLLAAAALT
jgi:fructokinase